MERTAADDAVIDESDLVVQSWSRAWTWRSLPTIMIQAARFVWDSSHRLTSLAVALGAILAVTYIPILLVLQDGIESIAQGGVEAGTHDDLVQRGGMYARLYRQQVKNLV